MPLRLMLPALLLVIGLIGACAPEQPDATPGDETGLQEPSPTPEQTPTQEPTPTPPEDADATPHDDEDGDAGPVEIEVSDVVTDLAAPWAVAFTDDERIFISERDTGHIRELLDDGSMGGVVRFDIDNAGEGGLLGLAWNDGKLYGYLTTSVDNRVIRIDPDDAGSMEVILDGIPKASIHNGGRIAFGPDEMLYIATGDAADPPASQDPESLAGKILRVTPDGDIPEDNPFEGSAVYALGLRNVQGLAWSDDGTMYASEFGPDVDDEINRIEPGGNYGWPEVTGEAGDERFIDPIVVRQPAEASWSGLVYLSDSAIPQWDGSLLAPSLRGNRLWRIELDEQGEVVGTEELLAGEHGRLRQAVQAPDGSLWVLTNNTDGRGSPASDDDRILRLGPPR